MVIDGRKIAQEILEQLKKEVADLPFKPKLIDVVIGDDPVIDSYVKIKAKRSSDIGLDFEIRRMPASIKQLDLENEISALNKTEKLCGMLVQLPLPENMVKQMVLDRIQPEFDVDCISSVNVGKLFTGEKVMFPPTAAAIMHVLSMQHVPLSGMEVLVIGAGDLVGKPTAFLLMQEHATVTIANQNTKDLAEHSRRADIIISGAGRAGILKGDMVKEGVIVIDAGTSESNSGISGDVDFESVSPKASLITPVPGGIGPVTVAMLLKNAVERAKWLTRKG